MNIARTVSGATKPIYTKPVKEQWTVTSSFPDPVERVTFQSTKDMLDSDKTLHGKRATYTYVSKQASEMRFRDRLKRIGSGAAVGAMAGLLPGTLLGLMGGFSQSGFSWGAGEGFAAFVTGVGLVGGAMTGYLASFGDQEVSLYGILQQQGEQVNFYRHLEGEVSEKIDLNAFQSAETPSLVEGQRDYGKQWWMKNKEVIV